MTHAFPWPLKPETGFASQRRTIMNIGELVVWVWEPHGARRYYTVNVRMHDKRIRSTHCHDLLDVYALLCELAAEVT